MLTKTMILTTTTKTKAVMITNNNVSDNDDDNESSNGQDKNYYDYGDNKDTDNANVRNDQSHQRCAKRGTHVTWTEVILTLRIHQCGQRQAQDRCRPRYSQSGNRCLETESPGEAETCTMTQCYILSSCIFHSNEANQND